MGALSTVLLINRCQCALNLLAELSFLVRLRNECFTLRRLGKTLFLDHGWNLVAGDLRSNRPMAGGDACASVGDRESDSGGILRELAVADSR